MLVDIRSQTAAELENQFRAWGQPAYRVRQLLEWLYPHRATDWEAMTNLPAVLRDELRKHYSLTGLELVRIQGAGDTTQKFLWRLRDQALIESVLIAANPALYGEPSDRHTLCVSTQVGCAYGCKFCASGLAGWKRNLGVEEIVGQVLAVERWNEDQSKVQSLKSKVQGHQAETGSDQCGSGARDQAAGMTHQAVRASQPSTLTPQLRLVSNLVIMGMGEPLANYENLLKALRILNAPWGGGIGARKITISTSGLAPQIRKLAEEPLQFRLAVSLHGATDDTRNQIMPVNRKYPLRELTAACEFYQKIKGRMITLEYVLIAGVNDSLDQAKPLATLARRLMAKVNLIPYNQIEGLPWQRPDDTRQEAFLSALQKQKVSATLRREKGGDIDAACGQLRLKTERELAGLEGAPAIATRNKGH
ncbi:MAG: 23S rRNA (adenine(2503)-C(2))-methyltransferase RlmN [Verrucomicrobia bacterium]|nr:23S rRNA (adenine(2503)-C(2))-methyltransferase RlmN [Verrucomicrobiota bacterium]